VPYEFVSWSDGNTNESRTYSFPETDTTLVATYQPATNLYLSDMPTKGTPINGKGPMELDKANGGSAAGDGKQITLAGVKYTKGLGVWSKSDVSYDLNKKFKSFITDIGIDDAVGDGGTVIFKVYLDGTKVYDSGTRKGSSSTKSLNIDVTGKSTLRLVVDSQDGSTSNDSADWAGARLVAVNAGTAPAFSNSSALCTNSVASPPSSRIIVGPLPSGHTSASTVHHQYSGSVSPFHANTGVPRGCCIVRFWRATSTSRPCGRRARTCGAIALRR
jgi:hypothetical protein